jgi:hypothetical protein
MNPKILEILPKKITEGRLVYGTDDPYHTRSSQMRSKYKSQGYNKALDEVTEALKNNDVCVCPSEGKLIELLFNLPVMITVEQEAKAIRKLILEGK